MGLDAFVAKLNCFVTLALSLSTPSSSSPVRSQTSPAVVKVRFPAFALQIVSSLTGAVISGAAMLSEALSGTCTLVVSCVVGVVGGGDHTDTSEASGDKVGLIRVKPYHLGSYTH